MVYAIKLEGLKVKDWRLRSMRLMREYEERRRYDHESGTRELQAASEPTLPWPTVPSEASRTYETPATESTQQPTMSGKRNI